MVETAVVSYSDPYTHVIIQGIRLPTYATGGINVSVGDLTRVIAANVEPCGLGASGFASISGPHGIEFHVVSGSGNILTIGAWWKASQELADGYAGLSAIPVKVEAWGH